MRRLLPRFVVLALTFAVGIAAHAVRHSPGGGAADALNAPGHEGYRFFLKPIQPSLTCELHRTVMRAGCVSYNSLTTFGTTYSERLARELLFPNFYSHRAGAERCESGGKPGTFYYVCPKCSAAKAAWETGRG